MAGYLVISLDFELYWGVRDRCALGSVAADLAQTRRVIPRMLALFEAYGIRATWATVGFLFCPSREALVAALPDAKPRYSRPRYSPYADLPGIGSGERDDPYRYGSSLIALIARCPGQEIGTHTFSHYFALEEGQTADAFGADLAAAAAVAADGGRRLRSLVFPRNQCNPDYLALCRDAGITAYRGNPDSWIYRARPRREEGRPLRLVRLLDAYLNLSGHHTYPPPGRPGGRAGAREPLDVPASRFLRPWSPRLRWLEGLRLRRIRRGMTRAARRNEVYHLWWHPENFGRHPEENLRVLEAVLQHFAALARRHGMRSCNMADMVDIADRAGAADRPDPAPAARRPQLDLSLGT